MPLIMIGLGKPEKQKDPKMKDKMKDKMKEKEDKVKYDEEDMEDSELDTLFGPVDEEEEEEDKKKDEEEDEEDLYSEDDDESEEDMLLADVFEALKKNKLDDFKVAMKSLLLLLKDQK